MAEMTLEEILDAHPKAIHALIWYALSPTDRVHINDIQQGDWRDITLFLGAHFNQWGRRHAVQICTREHLSAEDIIRQAWDLGFIEQAMLGKHLLERVLK